ncbi:hypothetical protein [Streptomyces sp. NPDC001389]|uniref:hypothetical protein n=1 Tax=Streptomyces sp. NPDC001389 TaxID=3364569 RepID=UPI0036D0C7AE
MSNLPRPTRVLTRQVNPDTTPAPNGLRVLVVGRFLPATCKSCGDFKSAKVVIGGELRTVHCTVCLLSPTAGLDDVMDDVEREDNGRGFEAEGLLGTPGRAA